MSKLDAMFGDIGQSKEAVARGIIEDRERAQKEAEKNRQGIFGGKKLSSFEDIDLDAMEADIDAQIEAALKAQDATARADAEADDLQALLDSITVSEEPGSDAPETESTDKLEPADLHEAPAVTEAAPQSASDERSIELDTSENSPAPEKEAPQEPTDQETLAEQNEGSALDMLADAQETETSIPPETIPEIALDIAPILETPELDLQSTLKDEAPDVPTASETDLVQEIPLESVLNKTDLAGDKPLDMQTKNVFDEPAEQKQAAEENPFTDDSQIVPVEFLGVAERHEQPAIFYFDTAFNNKKAAGCFVHHESSEKASVVAGSFDAEDEEDAYFIGAIAVLAYIERHGYKSVVIAAPEKTLRLLRRNALILRDGYSENRVSYIDMIKNVGAKAYIQFATKESTNACQQLAHLMAQAQVGLI